MVIAHGWLESANYGYISYNNLLSAVNNGTYNFIDPSKNSQAVRDALSPVLAKTSTSDLDSINVQASRDVFNLPGGPPSWGSAASSATKPRQRPGPEPGQRRSRPGQRPHHRQSHTVASAFAELGMPVLDNVEVNISGRYDHYSDFGGNFSPKIGVKYTPIKTVALRATVSKGFPRAVVLGVGQLGQPGFHELLVHELPGLRRGPWRQRVHQDLLALRTSPRPTRT
ncbi:TonB-dependent receptor domain-containing protein [Caulobacter segnis]